MFTPDQRTAWNEAMNNNCILPVGEYSVIITSAGLSNFKIVLECTVSSGELKHKKTKHFLNLDKPSIYWLIRKQLGFLGLGMCSLDALESELPKAVGAEVKIKASSYKKNSGDDGINYEIIGSINVPYIYEEPAEDIAF